MVVSRCVTGADARSASTSAKKASLRSSASPWCQIPGTGQTTSTLVSTNGLSLIHYMSEMGDMSEMGVAIGPAAVCLFAATMGIDPSISAVMLRSRDRQVQLRHHYRDRPSLVRAQLRGQEPTHAPQQTAHHSMNSRRWSQARAPFAPQGIPLRPSHPLAARG